MIGVVAEVSNERASYIFSEMPLKLVYSYEHFYYVKNGNKCSLVTPEQAQETLEQLIASL
jgi:superoxide dismutase